MSNRAAAKLGNAVLKDLGVVTEENLQMLLCPSKIVRQREKFGQLAAEKHSEKPPPGDHYHLCDPTDNNFDDLDGLYFDGKKCDTLVRETKCVNVQVDDFLFSAIYVK